MNSLEMNNIEEIKTLNPYQQEAVLEKPGMSGKCKCRERKDNSADRESAASA